jgi:signal transduction histidine kinase
MSPKSWLYDVGQMKYQRIVALLLLAYLYAVAVAFLWRALGAPSGDGPMGLPWWNSRSTTLWAGVLWGIFAIALLVRKFVHPGSLILAVCLLNLLSLAATVLEVSGYALGATAFAAALLVSAFFVPHTASMIVIGISTAAHVAAIAISGGGVSVVHILLGSILMSSTLWLDMENREWRRQMVLFDQARWAASQFTNVNVRMQDNMDRTAGTARAKERVRVAREVHDSVGYALTGSLLQIRAANKLLATDPAATAVRLEHVEEMIQSAIQDVRAEVSRLRDEDAIHRIGTSRWKRLCEAFADSTGIRVSATIPESLETVSEGISESVYRIIQESLTNSYRHGRADHVDVSMSLDLSPQKILLRISDNGSGAGAVQLGNGLKGMQERTSKLGGTLALQSSPGRGFDIGIEIPLGGHGDG